jgi:hypothetical protein
MTKPGSATRLSNIVAIALIALAFVLSDVASSSAECGGYCEARQVRAICHDAEFNKCKSDPLSYLASSARGDAQLGLE